MWPMRWCLPASPTCCVRSRSCWQQRWRRSTIATPMTSRHAAVPAVPAAPRRVCHVCRWGTPIQLPPLLSPVVHACPGLANSCFAALPPDFLPAHLLSCFSTLCLQAASKMAAFPPTDLVLAAPTFSRCLYAQLALQEYAPPRNYPMPMPTDPQARQRCRGSGCLLCVLQAGFGGRHA